MLSSIKDQEFDVPELPSDSISCVDWFPTFQDNQTLLSAASWDTTVRVWDVRLNNNTVQFAPKALVKHDSPVLSCCFTRQYALFSGGCDNIVKMHNIATNQTQVVGKHDAPISSIKFDDEKNILITGSWDKTIKFWDCRQQNPAFVVNLGVKVYTMDYAKMFLAAAGSDRNVYTLSLMNHQAPPKKVQVSLRMQLRSIALRNDAQVIAVASIEGRTNIIFPEDNSKSFTFRCHRLEERNLTKIFPVNCLHFHPTRETVLLSAGGDGTFVPWDTFQKQRLKTLKTYPSPVTQAKFDSTGQLCAVSLSYDWYKGYIENATSLHPPKLFVQIVDKDWVKRVPTLH